MPGPSSAVQEEEEEEEAAEEEYQRQWRGEKVFPRLLFSMQAEELSQAGRQGGGFCPRFPLTAQHHGSRGRREDGRGSHGSGGSSRALLMALCIEIPGDRTSQKEAPPPLQTASRSWLWKHNNPPLLPPRRQLRRGPPFPLACCRLGQEQQLQRRKVQQLLQPERQLLRQLQWWQERQQDPMEYLPPRGGSGEAI